MIKGKTIGLLFKRFNNSRLMIEYSSPNYIQPFSKWIFYFAHIVFPSETYHDMRTLGLRITLIKRTQK